MAVLINNTDIESVYGAIVVDGGYNGIMGWPASKPVDANDWHEYDGVEADLSALKLASMSFTMKFGLKYSTPAQIEAFYHFLNSLPTLQFESTDVSVSRVLRVKSMSSLQHALTFGLFTISFVCDQDILAGYSRQEPVSGLCPADPLFKIDGKKISDYGFIVLDGTYNNVLLPGEVKESTVRNISTINGSLYDSNPKLWDSTSQTWKQSSSHDTVRYKSVQVALSCGMVATSLATFWKNYLAFLYDLIHADSDASDVLQACQRQLYLGEVEKTLLCYYKKQSIKEFTYDHGRVWIKFDLTLEVTGTL